MEQETKTLKDIGWFERKENGLIYLYISDKERIRITINQLRYLSKQTKERGL